MQTPVVYQPGGEIQLGTPVVALPAYPKQTAPPPLLFGAPTSGSVSTPYYHAQPQGFAPSPYAAAVATAAPVAVGVSVAQAPPRAEVTARFTEGDLTNTGEVLYAGNHLEVAHANFFWNSITRLDGLDRFPNLIRLTLRGNELVQVIGLEACPNLRWLDVSLNCLTDFSGASQIRSLEFLDASDNDLKSLEGLGWAPNLTWLNVNNSNLTSLQGLRSLPNLKVLDAGKNELGTSNGVGFCPRLIELRLYINNLTDLAGVADLQELRALDVSSNDLDSASAPGLGGLGQLHTLNLSNNNLGTHPNLGALISAFSGHPNLRALSVGRNDFSPGAIEQLRSALRPGGCQVDASNVVPLEERSSGGDSGCGACAIA
ncbi:hypothetical protein T492DRAFT_1014778 [Pavlovales sp. CCMP2436]|nr:hypothetical protein T492DRAFT_1014778 [Pavlovales sp. CCMP2436]|mmetsp:Transcript_41525/g.96237  ORF Transcript_41525/g.96237 Transcript_41525/m.96237 type:complete len:372 (-) Transcript_41525:78-1193(-)